MNPQEYMKIALNEAKQAFLEDEVPVGAIIVNPNDGRIIAQAHNLSEHGKYAFSHAEIEVMQRACQELKQNRLWGLDLYVTLEPCTMCAAAASFMRINKIYFGAYDEKGGAIDNGVCFYSSKTCHHKPQCEGGILEKESSQLLKDFFKNKRHK